MTHDELVEKVARAINAVEGERHTPSLAHYKYAKAAIDTILDALQEPTEGMIDVVPVPYRCGRDWRQDAKATYHAMLSASPLGEQSE